MKKKWEYKRVYETQEERPNLNLVGDDGWELVSSVSWTGGGNTHSIYHTFKRPVNHERTK